ncbi:SAVED domain-containing protein [Rhizobium leguminosarum]|nr:SAVED domain-containing protein [Rhizobium leguminosarum]
MADAVVARQQGDDFQARWFWLQAANLLRPDGHVERVSFETGPKAFDDVVVEYSATLAPKDHFGRSVLRDHMQCKWHVRTGQFGYEDLADPAFSNATSLSFLHRAVEAQRQYAPAGDGARFQLVTNWDPVDPLRRLILSQTNSLDLAKLYEGGANSANGKIRAHWANRLGITEEELKLALGTLVVNTRVRSAEDIRAHLNDLFEAVGLRRISSSESGFVYDDVIKKLHAQGHKVFDRKAFREMVADEKLLASDEPPPRTTIGVRSFLHPINPIEARATRTLDLVPQFDGRYLREGHDWQGTVYPELKKFVLDEAGATDNLRLVLDAHMSLAYAVASILDVKSGKDLEIEQRSPERRFWSETDSKIDPDWPMLEFSEATAGDGSETAVGISVTLDVEHNVREHVAKMPEVGKLILAKFPTSASQRAVRSGAHAAALAESVARRIRASGRAPMAHLFIAAPNGLTFFLGRHHRTIGTVTIYEWDFEGLRDRDYSPGLVVR